MWLWAETSLSEIRQRADIKTIPLNRKIKMLEENQVLRLKPTGYDVTIQ